ncbi:MAG: GNAT family N-acetyltransferase [Candidatus Taylorbacteria bacterium CG11_big_fil_rev_8_21_14_0_20_46_11]|uniref:GNAT family N-acetyltransferase n=1 Tax=Candidatus Taylorbacteria bacterium CG11_big_fil_rev_8_21_14_0_20_46_11 TaxID=1975025 RepID=A0A2H0KD54_9BACT|nr:MAG: GNAT family N-acetyltransferase [Candidatus Taylorbacteria bacterium CG11_big_fil_rev_8_21_14_0_20_46_11]
MEIKKEEKQNGNAVRLSAVENGVELGAMYLYLIHNDSHTQPYGLLEDVLVKEEHRKRGIGTILVQEAFKEAKRLNCYKVIGTSRTSRENVHAWYEKLGMKKHGFEFRIDL